MLSIVKTDPFRENFSDNSSTFCESSLSLSLTAKWLRSPFLHKTAQKKGCGKVSLYDFALFRMTMHKITFNLPFLLRGWQMLRTYKSFAVLCQTIKRSERRNVYKAIKSIWNSNGFIILTVFNPSDGTLQGFCFMLLLTELTVNSWLKGWSKSVLWARIRGMGLYVPIKVLWCFEGSWGRKDACSMFEYWFEISQAVVKGNFLKNSNVSGLTRMEICFYYELSSQIVVHKNGFSGIFCCVSFMPFGTISVENKYSQNLR